MVVDTYQQIPEITRNPGSKIFRAADDTLRSQGMIASGRGVIIQELPSMMASTLSKDAAAFASRVSEVTIKT